MLPAAGRCSFTLWLQVKVCTRWTAAGSNLCSATVCIVGFVWNAEAVTCLVNSSFHPCVVDPITTLLFGQTAVKCFCFIKSSLNPLSQVRLVRLVWAVSKSLTDELTEKNGQREDRVLKAAVKTYSTPTPWSQILSLYCPILFQRFFHIKKKSILWISPKYERLWNIYSTSTCCRLSFYWSVPALYRGFPFDPSVHCRFYKKINIYILEKS